MAIWPNSLYEENSIRCVEINLRLWNDARVGRTVAPKANRMCWARFVCVLLQVRMDCDAAAGKRTHATRRWNWRKSSTRTTTWRGGGASKWRTPCASPSDRSRSGSRTGVWSSKKRSRPSKSSTSRRRPHRAAARPAALARASRVPVPTRHRHRRPPRTSSAPTPVTEKTNSSTSSSSSSSSLPSSSASSSDHHSSRIADPATPWTHPPAQRTNIQTTSTQRKPTQWKTKADPLPLHDSLHRHRSSFIGHHFDIKEKSRTQKTNKQTKNWLT